LLVFGIIWAAFLIPSWRRSPASTVEDFEERMKLLAEANRSSPGRWVLVPRKGQRFLGPQDRQRARMRRRRRFVFVALLEVTALTFLMGMFQPLRSMWLATVFLAATLVVYIGMLLRLRAVEAARAERRRRMDSYQRPSSYSNGAAGYRNGHPADNGNGHAAYGAGRQVVAAARSGNGNGDGNGNGHSHGYGSFESLDERYLPASRYLSDGGIQIMDEDVHVIVRRSDEVDLQALRASNGASAD
jgi:hypothetical protein